MIQFIRSLKPIEEKSFFVFGARGVGKSTFIRHFLKDKISIYIDLLSPANEDKYSKHPDVMVSEILPHKDQLDWTVIDEVQKCPKLLDVVQMLIAEHQLKFILSGSSARRLKQKGVNLLAGRALNEYMFPLTHIELGSNFDLQSVLETGSLPEVRTTESVVTQHAFLRAYALNYVTTEIQAEQWVKNIPPFRRFLDVAGQMNGKIISYSRIAKDIGVDPNTVQSYFEILEDTLIGIRLPGFSRSLRKQQRQAPKFYLFDLGIKRASDRTLDVPLKPQTSAYGEAFEHFIIVEIMRLASYARKDFRYSYLLTKDGAEIDLIVDRPGQPVVLLEIKSKDRVDRQDVRHLKHFENDFEDPLRLVVSNDEIEKNFDGIKCLHWSQGIKLIVDQPSPM